MLQKIGSFMSRLSIKKLIAVKPIFKTRYPKWNDQKLTKKVAIITTFVLVLGASIFTINYLNSANATWNNLITWTSSSDFSTNAVTTGTATTNTLVDTTSVSGSAKLIKPSTTSKTISAGIYQSFMVKNDGTLWATGYNYDGRLGTGDYNSKDTFTQVATDVASVETSNYGSSFYIKKDGTLWATGANVGGPLGLGSSPTYNTWTQTLTNVKQISSGNGHSVALKNDGTVWIAGANAVGQLGFGDYTPRNTWTQVTNANVVSGVVSVTASNVSTFLVKSDGTVWVAGGNANGQLGIGDTNVRLTWTQAPALSGITKVVGYYISALALKNDGTVWVTGSNASGQLGLGNYSNQTTWIQSGIAGVADIESGYSHSLAVKADGSLWGCGATSAGALGIAGAARVSWSNLNVSNVTELTAGTDYTMIRKADGSTQVTGNNNYGQLGLSDKVYYNSWQENSLGGMASVSSSSYSQSQFAVGADGTLWATGENTLGQLGLGDSLNRFTFQKTSLTNVVKAVASNGFSYALKSDKTLWATGSNGYGIFGLGNNTNSNVWIQVLTNVSDIQSYYAHTLALKADGTVWVTGQNNYGQQGFGDSTTKNTWAQVPGFTNAVAIAAADSASIIVTSTGELWGSGYNAVGQLGLNSLVQKTAFTKSTAAAVAANPVVKVWMGVQSTFMKRADGTVWAVGLNSSGQLGVGDYLNKTDWVRLTNFDNATDIVSNQQGTFILKADKSLYATGVARFGELSAGGINCYFRSSTLTQVATNVNSAAVGFRQSAMVKADGKTYTAGANTIGSQGIAVPSDYLNFNFINSLTNVKRANAFYSTGTISNLKIDSGVGKVSKWNSLTWSTSALPAGTSVKFRTRGAATEAGLTDATWSSYLVVSGDSILTSSSRWLEVELILSTSDGLYTPTLDSFSVNYFTDTTAPSNPTVPVSAWNSSGKSVSITNSTDLAPVYKNYNQPYFEFNSASDEVDGSGVAGYYVYFGPTISADPLTAGAYQASVGSGVQNFTPAQAITVDGPYYLRIKTKDNALNVSEAVTAFTYNYDKTVPLSPSLLSVSPFGWASSNDFTFNWSTGFDEDTSYPSGLAGYQYKLGGTADNWSGTVVHATNPDLGDYGAVVSTESLSAVNIKAYQNGQNIFYVRSIDKAGNVGQIKQTNYYYNGDAPSAPQSITVNPQSATANSFTFTWNQPASFNGGIKGYRYSVNSSPQENNTTYIALAGLPLTADSGPSYNPTTHIFTLNNIPAATLQNFNYIYVVAVDANDKVSYAESNVASIGFECVTPAPGIPVGVIAFDTSNRDTAEYAVALKWTKPENEGVGFSGYDIYRSTTSTFSEVPIGSSTSASFIDTDLQSIEYFYKVKSKDNSGNFSSDSTVVSLTPTGKYTKPPVITIQPEVLAKVSTTSIRWVTDRQSTSFVEYGEDINYGLEQGKQGGGKVTDHTVLVLGLKPDTVYYYRVGYSDQDGNTGYSDGGTFRTQPAPRIERVNVQDIRLYTAIITWYTSEPATSDLIYGKSSNYSTELKNVSGGATTVHSVRLDGLDHSSTYHFAIRITDADDNQVLSDDYSFDTLQYPKLSNVKFQPMADQSTSTFKITWDSNVPTTSVVEFRPDGGKVQETVKSKLELKHEIIVSGLLDNTYYLLNVVGVDQYGNSVSSDVNRIKTDFDTRPPALTSPIVEVSSSDFGTEAKNQIVVSWETDEPSTSQVEYGVGVTGENYDNRSQEDANMTTSHVVIVVGLLPSSAYHIRAISRDESDNKGISESESILTEQARSSVLDIVLGSLQASLGWLLGLR